MNSIQINAQIMIESERNRYLELHPTSIDLSHASHQHFLYGVPMHWMNDWGTPTPLFVQSANGAHFTCADGLEYADFCLGDTGAMFGHSPPAVAKAIATQVSNGYTAMLPSTLAPAVGEALSDFFWVRSLATSDYRNRCQPLYVALGAVCDWSQ